MVFIILAWIGGGILFGLFLWFTWIMNDADVRIENAISQQKFDEANKPKQ